MKVYLDTIGCRLNQAEIEIYARQFRAAGHTLVAAPEQADLAVVNTCTVTSAAAADSRQKIRQVSCAGQVVATGCWATLRPENAASLPGVTQVVPNWAKDRLVPDLLHISPEIFELEPVERTFVPGARLRTRAFIKVQDGCDNRCTYCITTIARGASRSRTIRDILADIRAVLGEGSCEGCEIGMSGAAQEIVLTGVHLGSWGQDFSPSNSLSTLIQAILEDTDVARLRLSSLEPWDLETDFFAQWKDPRLCRQLHLPLQSGSGGTLRRMGRKITPQLLADLVTAARVTIPGVAITTDIITGFPGESQAEFEESLEFVRQMCFADGHVFTYSAVPGTPAARMPDQVPSRVRKERNASMRAALAESAHDYRSGFLGQVLPVLWESATEIETGVWQLSGLTDNYLRVHAHTHHCLWNQITPVHLDRLTSSGIKGVIIPIDPAHETG
jgi:threonylcarbamoyladenosine tRNA methylthiotransferase MtaB